MLEFNLFGIPYVSKTLESPFLHLLLSVIAASTREPADSNLYDYILEENIRSCLIGYKAITMNQCFYCI